MAYHCQYEERMAEREQRGGLCRNRWNALRTRVMGCEEDRKEVYSIRREAQQGVRCWGCGELGHCCYDLITQVATLALRLEDGLRVEGKRMHNRLSVRRYSVSTGAYILIVV